MEILIYILLSLIVFNSAMKISLWPWWWRLVFTLLLGIFAYLSIDYAVVQSKTQIASWLHNVDILQFIAIIVTLDSAVGIVYCLLYFNNDGKRSRTHFWSRLLHAYPGLLVIPVVFYLLTRLIFLHVGADFHTTGLIYAIAVVVVLTLCAEAARWLLPTNELRVEAHLWLTVMVCLFSLFLTQDSNIVYQSDLGTIDWTSMLLTLGAAAIVVFTGFVVNRIKWKSRNRTNKWK